MRIWKDIPDYEGYYQASNDGLIRSVTKSVRQWSGGTQLKKGKVLKPCADRLGYIKVALSKENKLRAFTVHRLVGLAHIPNPNGYKELNHKDGDKSNNHVDNLEWCNRHHNIRHAVKTGLLIHKRGDDNPCTLFKTSEHPSILKMHSEGLTAPAIARILGCSHYTIYRIVNPDKYSTRRKRIK